VSLDLDEIRERALLTRDGFYHVVGAHRVMREADFDALVAEVERLREDAVVARSAETTLTVRDEERLAALLDAERENTALRLENERLRANAEARERFLKREGDLLRAVERERDELRLARARLEDFSYGQKLALNNADVNHNAVLFALSDEGGHNGWRPSRGLDALVDRALAVREERDALRAQRALDNDALARAWDEGRDMERAASVAFLREGDTVCMECGDRAALDLAYRIERGDHRREETTP
jgi:hypothetical protein